MYTRNHVSTVDNNNGIDHTIFINITTVHWYTVMKTNNDVEFYFELFTSWKNVWITISVALDQTCIGPVHHCETCSWGLGG